jgi:hypothetical protein
LIKIIDMAQTVNEQADGHIGGVSLASFLQMLEQERKSCTLQVASGKVSGSFYFEEGELIDAECEDVVGQEAVYILLALDNPTFKVTDVEDRLHRITQPLAHLLLNAATRIDEEKHESGTRKVAANQGGSVSAQANPALKRLIETIVDIAGVKHYYLLNRQGKMITQSSKNQKIGDFITYCIVSGIQIRKSLEAKGPHRIKLVMENGDILLVLPGAGMIIGLLLDEHASIPDVTARLRPALANK